MKKILSIALALMLIFSLCACASKNVSEENAVVVSTSAKTGGAVFASAPMEVPAVNYAMADMAAAEEFGGLSAARGADSGLAVSGNIDADQTKPDKIIYSAEATVETTDFDGATGRIAEMVGEYGGWVESSSVNGSNYYDQSRGRVSTRSAFYSIRIPSERFNELMSALPALGNVPYSYTYTENVSERYYDAEARLTAYTAQEQRLIEMLELAASVDDIIAIEEKLTELRYQIESLQSSLNSWDRQVSYSLVNLNLQEVEEYTPQAVVQPSYGEKLISAIKTGFESVGDFFSELLLWLVEALPSIVLIVVLLFVLVKLVKLRRAKKKQRSSNSSKEN